MPSASATKASDKAQACRKLTTLLQKDYRRTQPVLKLPVLEGMLFAVCLEDSSWEDADAACQKLLKSYFDLNEIRVSSVGELEATLSNLKNADWKGLRIRSILRFVFESTYSFDFEKLSKLTLESAQKRLKKIDYLSPFVTGFTLQQVLGCHLVCLDTSCHRAAIHLGIVPPDSTIEEASEFLKAGVKKSDSVNFAFLLRCFATDPKFAERIMDEFDDDDEFDVLKVEQRLDVLKAPKKKKPPQKKTSEKTSTKSSAKQSTAKSSTKKATATAQKKSTKSSKAASKQTSTKSASRSKADGKTAPKAAAKKKTGTRAATKSGARKKS